jgi:integration host factor subunit alpha
MEGSVMSLNKDSLAEIISRKYSFSKKRSTQLIENTLEIIKKRLAEGENVLISGFGKLSVIDKRERRGRNPANGNELMLGAGRVVTFRCSPLLKEKLNGKF